MVIAIPAPTNRAGRARDNYCLAFLRLADIEQTEIRSQTRSTENTQRRTRRYSRYQLHQRLSFGNVVQAPTKHSRH